jgi:hypothetical protein
MLKEVDECLDIRWISAVVGDEHSYEGRYALVTILPANDPVRRLGDEDTIIGWFTTEMSKAKERPLPCDEMEATVKGYLAAMDGTKHRLKHRMAEATEMNKKMYDTRAADYKDEALQRALDRRRSMLGIPYVSGYRRSY